MPRFETPLSVRVRRAAVSALLLLGVLALPVHGQTTLVQNGATVQVSDGGVWDLHGGTMDFGPAGATARLDEQSAGRVTNGTLTATRDFGSPSQADPAGLGAVLSASSTLGEIAVTRGHSVQDATNGNTSIGRYYDISPAQNNSGLDATLTFGYADAELNGLAESDLELFKSGDGGATWSGEGADGRDGTANTVTLSGISSFSRLTLGSQANPLPVELAGFKGTTTENGVRLTWRTASEQNNAGFRVQRRVADASTPGVRRAEAGWQTVGRVAGAGTTTEAQAYRFTDEALPYAADRFTYRLKQVDTDGTTSYSDEVVVERGAVNQLQLLGTYPNPARTTATVRYAVPEGSEADVRLHLYDVLGREVRTVTTGAKAGRHKRQFDTGDLSSGVYFLRLQVGGAVKTRRLTVVQ